MCQRIPCLTLGRQAWEPTEEMKAFTKEADETKEFASILATML